MSQSPFRIAQLLMLALLERDNAVNVVIDVLGKSVGYATWAHKVLAFLLSAALSGVAGALYVIAHGVVSLDVLSWTTSGQVVMTTLLGGTGTFLGPLVGSAVTVLLRDALSRSSAPPGLVTGLVFVATVLFFRRGIVGTLGVVWRNWQARRAPSGRPPLKR